MAEFVPGDDWDLEAVVRGYMSQAASNTACGDIMEWFDPFIEDPLTRSDSSIPFDIFPGFSETDTILDDFEGLSDDVAMVPATGVVGSSGGHIEPGGGSSLVAEPAEDVHGGLHTTTKYKRRKNQHKQVVQHVTADGISSDLWAWRKYGQKPIKGSPYPRSYYRCSSSKGCLARKQVERSNSEPGTFIVTYTGEHNHTQPTRRSALAGITRPTKFSSPNKKKPDAGATINPTKGKLFEHKSPRRVTTDNNQESSPSSTTTTMEEGPCKVGKLSSDGDNKAVNNNLFSTSLVLGEEIFMGFDELEGFGLDFGFNSC